MRPDRDDRASLPQRHQQGSGNALTNAAWRSVKTRRGRSPCSTAQRQEPLRRRRSATARETGLAQALRRHALTLAPGLSRVALSELGQV